MTSCYWVRSSDVAPFSGRECQVALICFSQLCLFVENVADFVTRIENADGWLCYLAWLLVMSLFSGGIFPCQFYLSKREGSALVVSQNNTNTMPILWHYSIPRFRLISKNFTKVTWWTCPKIAEDCWLRKSEESQRRTKDVLTVIQPECT